jgi:hypothetical protein
LPDTLKTQGFGYWQQNFNKIQHGAIIKKFEDSLNKKRQISKLSQSKRTTLVSSNPARQSLENEKMLKVL